MYTSLNDIEGSPVLFMAMLCLFLSYIQDVIVFWKMLPKLPKSEVYVTVMLNQENSEAKKNPFSLCHFSEAHGKTQQPTSQIFMIMTRQL